MKQEEITGLPYTVLNAKMHYRKSAGNTPKGVFYFIELILQTFHLKQKPAQINEQAYL